MESFVGKTLKNQKDEEYIVISEFTCKDIPCVYAMKVLESEKEGERSFFQITNIDNNPSLVNIKSKKMLSILNDALMKKTQEKNIPRKIGDDESIQDYLAYLDEFYRSKIVTVL